MNSAEKVKLYLREISPSFMGKFFYYFIPFRRAIVLANIKLILGESLSEAEQIKLAQCSYGSFAKFIKENLMLRFLSIRAIEAQVEFRGIEHMEKALAKNRGVLFLSGHFGNWELGAVSGFSKLKSQLGAHKVYCIRKTFSHEFVDRMFFSPFQKANIGIITKEKGLRSTLKALKAGHAIIMVFDQHASPGRSGVLTYFFDKPVGSHRSLAKLVKATQAAVVPLSSFRLPSGKHIFELHPELPFIENADPEQEQILNTQAYNDFIEQTIVAHPEQWIWMHRRWKYFTKNREMFNEHTKI